ncbi:MAG: hypothetical protein V1897_13170 [Pseudomonadota bacterium]
MGIAKLIGLFKSDPEPSPVQVTVPGKTQAELDLIDLQNKVLTQATTQTPEQAALAAKQTEYYNQMLADNTLSPEEEADFEKEYELQLQALNETYGRETTKAGGTQMAELVSRGMLDTTTGRDIIADTQEKSAEQLATQISSMGEAKEFAKYDMELAKRNLAQTGYALTSGIKAANLQTALQAAMSAENYYAGRGGLEANAALQNALAAQSRNQAEYKNRMGIWGGMLGLGQSMVMKGASGGGG